MAIFPQDRLLSVTKGNNQAEPLPLYKRTPQGSSISPTLYNTMIIDPLKHGKAPAQTFKFGNDGAI